MEVQHYAHYITVEKATLSTNTRLILIIMLKRLLQSTNTLKLALRILLLNNQSVQIQHSNFSVSSNISTRQCIKKLMGVGKNGTSADQHQQTQQRKLLNIL
ncbi:conserved hypothetical protein [Trichinella spiralis]|uniref:hypothetical protein n=1 Tax=Trichinella spiralis TaxID=6334 RepID=UPI0001EFB1FE|nr:conserved hypothetical protein [Trichinella spiralis]